MKKITYFMLFILTALSTFAQSQTLTEQDVKFWIGEGDKKAYVLVDFNDGSEDYAYYWGVRFSNSITGIQLLETIKQAEPKFDYDQTSGYLNEISFNHHTLPNDDLYDDWSIWSGNSYEDLATLGGIATTYSNDEVWFGLSFGWMISNMGATKPRLHLPAYSSQWFGPEDITTWLGQGSKKAILVIDFNQDQTNTVTSFAWGIQFDGNLTGAQALGIVSSETENFSYEIENNQAKRISFGSYTATANNTASWKPFVGTNLSDWTHEGINLIHTMTQTNSWFGLSYGNDTVRLPYAPSAAEFDLMRIEDHQIDDLRLYPNPVVDYLNITAAEVIDTVELYNIRGQKVFSQKHPQTSLDLSVLQSGTYFVKINSGSKTVTKKMIKK